MSGLRNDSLLVSPVPFLLATFNDTSTNRGRKHDARLVIHFTAFETEPTPECVVPIQGARPVHLLSVVGV